MIQRLLRPTVLGFALVLAAATALPFFTTATTDEQFDFEVSLTASERGYAQLFYDTGRDFNEEQSVTRPLVPGAAATLHFPIPGNFTRLRLDPHNAEARVELRDARIVSNRRGPLVSFSAAELGTLKGIASRDDLGATLKLQTGVDASLLLTPAAPLGFKDKTFRYRRALGPFAIAFVLVLVLYAAAGSGAGARAGSRALEWARAHPRRAVAAAATLAVLLQCHPVIFFGKSFVSPDNATLLLYDTYPVLPGYDSKELEDAKGSDVGAMMWGHLVAPVLEHDALFDDRELPLWNRYVMNGLPFLGQGQSMFGDPLNWLTIVTRGAAWSWDARFVLTRWLLCCGVGLTVLLLTAELGPALLMTAAAGFLGYFGFRLNHAANFSLCYSAWILVAWAGLLRAPSLRAEIRCALLLVVSSFAVYTSGTVKEASMLIACLNAAGALLVVLDGAAARVRLRRLALAAAAGGMMLLIAAPLVLSFVSTLQRSFTSYDQPAAAQINPAFLVTFFDDLFSRQTYQNETVSTPATNFIFLVGLAWAFAAVRDVANRRAFAALLLAALLPFGMVFGIVPERWITAVPFIRNIHHIDNTFSCVLIVLSAVLAGFGFSALFRLAGRIEWRIAYLQFLALAGALVGIYWAATQRVAKSDFFVGYSWSIVAVALILPLAIDRAARRRDPALLAALLLSSFALLTWRHAQYLRSPFDAYVYNPKVRADLHADSPAINFVAAKATEPSRPIGLGLNLFAGFMQMYQVESILGIDPLRNRYHDELAAALGLPRVREAATPMPDEEAGTFGPSLDALNVRYYLAHHTEKPRELPGLKALGSFDLDVYERATAWPRAFFSDRLQVYGEVSDLAGRMRRSVGQPLAAVQQSDKSVPEEATRLRRDAAGQSIRPAHDYRLTTNTTSFTVDAPSAGVVVLSEGYYPDEFQATLNGQPVPYFRANHNSKAIYIPQAGRYAVRFAYWPHHFTLALVLCAVGCAALAAVAAFALRRAPALRTAPAVPPLQTG